VVVTASKTLQIERALRRHGHDESAVRARIAAQLPMSEKVKSADLVIDNEGTLEQLRNLADAILGEVCRMVNIDAAHYGLE